MRSDPTRSVSRRLRRTARRRRWLLARGGIVARAASRRLQQRTARGARFLSSSWAGRSDVEEVAGEALEALHALAPRVEAQGRKLDRLPAALPLSKSARLQRQSLVRRLRLDLAAARTASDLLLRLGDEPPGGGGQPRAFVEALHERSDALIVLVQKVKNQHATEEAILALDAAREGLLPEESALLVEAMESARASLAWYRATSARRAPSPPASVARRLRELRCELASVCWALDLVAEVQARVFARAAPPGPTEYRFGELREGGSLTPEAFAPPTARPPWTLRQVGRWLLSGALRILHGRARARALRAHRAVTLVHRALREEAVSMGYSLPEAWTGAHRDPRILPPRDDASPAPDAGASVN